MFVTHYYANNATASLLNYFIQLKIFISKYWVCTSAMIKDHWKKDGLGTSTSTDQMENIVQTCVDYLLAQHKAAKRRLGQEKYVRQGEKEKLDNEKLPDMVGYRRT
jgi:hypothetical protein